ncbi:MAG: DUF6702 family protein, partial [Bacteroidota bacterium]
YNEQTGALEMSLKVFTDDLEEAVKTSSNTDLFLDTQKERSSADSLIGLYLEQQVQFEVDGQALNINFLGKEYEADGTWLYIEIPCKKPTKALTVRNYVFMELFDDQQNIIHLAIDNQTKSFILHKGHKSQTINW